MNPAVDTPKAEIEAALGFELKSLTRIPEGASSYNFKAERASDGYTFLIKLFREDQLKYYEPLLKNLALTEGTKAVKRVFSSSAAKVEGMPILCLEWAKGKSTFPDELPLGNLKDFAADYSEFSACLQRSTWAFSPRPLNDYYEKVMSAKGLFAPLVKRLVKAEIGPIEYDSTGLKVIHGDFHAGNFTCEAGRIAAIFDLEEFRLGLPAEDIVRYIVCAAEHLRWYRQSRKIKMLSTFDALIEAFDYAKSDWEMAIKVLWLRKLGLKVKRGRLSFAQAINLLFVSRFYRELLKLVRRVS